MHVAGEDWTVTTRRESAATFHARDLTAPARREVWVADATGPALVLGSAQSEDVVDRDACERRGIEVVRRRSGGGVVLVNPDILWLDVIVPAGDSLWEADVGRSFHWLGAAWAAALDDVGIRADVHHGAMVTSEWSSLVCFAGLGPGEVTTPEGAKLVGLSQRRSRAGSRFQCAALLRWEPAELLELLALDPGARAEARAELSRRAGAVTASRSTLLERLLHRLP